MAGHTVGKRKARVKPKNSPRKKAKLSPTKSLPKLSQSMWIPYQSSEADTSYKGKSCLSCNSAPEIPTWIKQDTGDILCTECGVNRVTTSTDDSERVHSADDHVAQIPPTEQTSPDDHTIQPIDNERSTSPELFDTGHTIQVISQ